MRKFPDICYPSLGHESRATSDVLAARSNAQGSAKNSNIFKYFQTFHTIFRTFRTTFRIFSNVFKRFRSFLSETCISFAKILMCFCLIGRQVRKTPAFDRVGLQVWATATRAPPILPILTTIKYEGDHLHYFNNPAHKKARFLTTESGFGGGWWKAYEISADEYSYPQPFMFSCCIFVRFARNSLIKVKEKSTFFASNQACFWKIPKFFYFFLRICEFSPKT